MNRRTKLLIGLGFAASLASPAFAQRTAKSGDAPPAPEGAPAAGGASESAKSGTSPSKGQAGKTYDVRVVFDEDSGKGEILCKQGEDKGDHIEYAKCAKDKLDRYDDVAVKKGIVASKEAYGKLSNAQKDAAKKAAFYDSALDKVKAKLAESAQPGGKDRTYEKKQYKGVLREVSKGYKKAVAQCQKAGELKCPEAAKAAESAGEAADPAGDKKN